MAGNGKYKYWISKEGLLRIEGWAREGLTDKQIASNMGINIATFHRWKNKYCELCDPLKRGKEVVDRQVENALLKRALGYTYDEITECTDDKGKTSTKVITKQVIPDVTAQIFWLKNRKPDKWREKRELEVNNEQQSSVMNELINSLKQRGN